MLKPWVVQALFWFIRIGLVVVLAGSVAIIWHIGFRRLKPSFATVTAIIVLVTFYFVVAYAGALLEHDQIVLCGGFLSLFVSAWILSFRAKSLWMILAHIPVVLGLALGGLLLATSLFPNSDPSVHEWEQRIGRSLVCRTYPKGGDSLPVTRLMLLRETDDRFNDEILDDSLSDISPVICRCADAANGARVVIEMQNKEGKVQRREIPIDGAIDRRD